MLPYLIGLKLAYFGAENIWLDHVGKVTMAYRAFNFFYNILVTWLLFWLVFR
jgi:hypothetical protein